MEPAESRRGAFRAFAIAALAVLGLALSFTPAVQRADAALLDLQWSLLRAMDPRPAPDDIVVVGIDEASYRSFPEPPGMWHSQLGMTLVRLASARPRAIGIDIPLPERSFEAVRGGLDKALLVGLAAARSNGPLVAGLSVDAATRTARPIYPPYLAVLGEEGLGISLLARDGDGDVRRFSITLPTEDGAFPTLAGRLCRALSRRCGDGLVHYALGRPFGYVPMRQLLELRDEQALARLFRDRIVLIGMALPHADRVPVPVNYAGWETARGDSPAIVVHAQSLRTALLDAAPGEASRPLVLVLVTLAAVVALIRRRAAAVALGFLAPLALLAFGVLALRGGWHVPVAAAMLTLLLGWAARLAGPWIGRRAARPAAVSDIPHSR